MKSIVTLCFFLFSFACLCGEESKFSHLLEDVSLHQSELARFVAIYSLVDELDESELEAVLRELSSKTDQSTLELTRRDMQIAIFQRIASSDPNKALKLALEGNGSDRGELVRTVFDVWARTDLASAIASANDLEQKEKIAALTGVVKSQSNRSWSKIHGIARQLDIRGDLVTETIAQFANAEFIPNPQQAWIDFAIVLPPDPSEKCRELLIGLAVRWFNQDGIGAMDEIRETLFRGRFPQTIFDNILHEIAQQSPQIALDYVLNLPSRHYSTENVVIRAWAEIDLESAREAVATVNASEIREDLQRSIVAVWAENEPHFILENLDVVPEPARYEAVQVSAETIAESSVKEAGELALRIEDPKLRTMAVRWLLPIWSERAPKSLLDWLLADRSNLELVSEVREQLVHNAVDSDPRRAFQLALQHPIVGWEPGLDGAVQQLDFGVPFPTKGVGLEAKILNRIAQSDLETAKRLLPRVRSGESKLVGALQVGRELIYRGDVQDAFDLSRKLPRADRNRYYIGLAYNWIEDDPIDLLESVAVFPSEELRSFVATQLVRWDRRHDILTESQLHELHQHLSEVDRYRALRE
ncbi:MAG: hypothetical protein OXG24_06520 [Gammaproteobacteria bacterium]|nr:hypothetical protein [Gammaproteobacteria bacterium]